MSHIVRFTNPPINEIVFGIQFSTENDLQAVHQGRFSVELSDDYPNYQDALELPTITESLQIQILPPLRRVFYIEKGDRRLIQLQSNRFLYNCRKVLNSENYPQFSDIKEEFMKRWDQFVRFCEKEALAPVHTKLYELSYINLIKEGNVWNEFSELGDMINLFSTNNADVYNRLNGIEFNTSFLTGDQNNEISISVKTGRYKDDARQYDSRLILLDLTQRGKAETNELQIEWFDNARANLNKTFVSILADKARLEWS